ncbi:MAG TPA: hypothetical protein VFQ71_06545 [Gaiellales bacterium]|nr:hypothetical protein [Gaiellales bacterium]
MRRALIASSTVVGWAAVALAAGALLPIQAALAVAVAVSLGLPGWALLRVTGVTERLDTIACLGLIPGAGLIVWAPALALGMAAGLPFNGVLAVVGVASAAGFVPERDRRRAPAGDLAIAAAGALLGFLLGTRWQWSFYGDELFHAGRIRKLLALDRLSLDGVSTYLNGQPHAGYAFPLLHAAQAGAIDLVRADPTHAYPNLSPAFAMLLPVVLFATGRAIGGTAVGLSAMTLGLFDAVQVAPNLGQLQWPGPYVLFLLIPVALLAAVEALREPGDPWLEAGVAAIAGCAAFVHPTYIVMLLAMLAGIAVLTRRGWRSLVASAAVSAAILGWIWWVALRGAHIAKPASGQWRVATPVDYVLVSGHAIASTAADVVQGRLPFLLAALALPVLLLWRDRRYALAAAAMTGPLLVVALPGPAAAGIATIGVGQTHRLPEAIPWVFTLAMALALAVVNVRPRLIAAAAVAAGLGALALAGADHVWRQRNWSWLPMTPIALLAAAIVILYLLRGLRAGGAVPRAAPAATFLLTVLVLVVPVARQAHTLASDIRHGVSAPAARPVPPGIIPLLRPVPADGHLPVVLARPDLSYRLVGSADIYAVAVPEVRSRAEPKNHPAQRRAAVARFLDPSTGAGVRRAIADRYDVRYVVAGAPGRRPSATARQLARDPSFRRLRTIHDGGVTYVVLERLPAGR